MPRPYTLSDGTTDVPLPPGLWWADELTFSPVAQSVEYSITGAVIVQSGVKLSGWKIDLAPIAPDADTLLALSAWQQVQAWARVPEQQLTLTDAAGTAYEVVFRHDESPALSAAPLWPGEADQPADLVRITSIKLLTVES
jgi:hypothetical protein